ncbi:MAG: hypothetical protein GTN89_15955 [Acidobacteria bacterium]|nr:hypothetical protein [Acidobacteriota bacterium]NIO60734.1 hypothetical protein [Acidobacteriota bacterium]NIQ31797.1 hypothetical protein [Acidobacteriota bacterium]
MVDEIDQPVASATVTLQKIDNTDRRHYFRERRETDHVGRVGFDSVGPGRYAIRVLAERGQFVSLPDHPSIEQHSITVEDDARQLVSTVRLVRGTPVVFRVSVGGQELPGARMLLHDLDREYRTEIAMNELIEREVRLVAGRWTARVDPVPGYLLTSVEVNRTLFPNDVAEFDLPLSAQAWYVNFEFAALATIGGRVTFKKDAFGMSVVSHLMEPGAWLSAAQARGGSKYDRVSARPIYPTYEYEMVVPTGLWTVRPESPGLEFSEPPEARVRLEAGDYEVIDFVVDGSPRGGRDSVRVLVEGPDGRRVRGAQVEAWPADPDARGREPIAEDKAAWWDAFLYGLADQEHLFVAGKPGYVEAGTLFTPDPKKRQVRLQLGKGATVHAVALDGEGEPTPDVNVALTRGDDYVSLLTDREVIDWVARPAGKTDGSGHLWLRGVYPGLYVLSGSFESKDESMFFAEFRNKGDTSWQREMDKVYRDTETDEIEIRLAPAGVLRATLHCSDGGELPPEADLLVLDGVPNDEPDSWWENGVLRSKAHVLEGERRNTFHIGPLDTGAYNLLVRPQGHNRWTWAIGTEAPEEAAVLTVAAGSPTDLGAIPIDCAPAISVVPIPPDGIDLPDLIKTGIFDPPAELTGTWTTGDGDERRIGHGRLVAEPDHVQFRDLPEGEIRSTVTLWNPLFLPKPSLDISVNATLERGKTVEVSPPLPGIGGAIEIDLAQVQLDGASVRAIRVAPLHERPGERTSEPRNVEVDGSKVIVTSLPEGDYDLDLCFDLECASRVPLWRGVEIEAGVILSPTASPR